MAELTADTSRVLFMAQVIIFAPYAACVAHMFVCTNVLCVVFQQLCRALMVAPVASAAENEMLCVWNVFGSSAVKTRHTGMFNSHNHIR
jgi:hypothetical protein